ncbi:MAG: hypothetical protein ACK5JR_02150 [Tropicimonas sp.]|uniref:hypothetical protein n=1 Tax=Tropicimonas sp. TaxID=2067044 RepID=UPI003A89B37A
MRPLVLSLALLALAPGAEAQGPLTATEFDALTRGRTLLYSSAGRAYGAERYEAGRKVTWSFLDGDCLSGRWYPQGGLICFAYESPETGPLPPRCWNFHADGTGIQAEFPVPGADPELYRAEEAGEDLTCLGPKTGV